MITLSRQQILSLRYCTLFLLLSQTVIWNNFGQIQSCEFLPVHDLQSAKILFCI